ncbi:uncharacterized protein TNCV_2389081 [Trichonephila clavipes]|nr:uncharacterized protein TNCV_2389081 [Trichonephila clavipes]
MNLVILNHGQVTWKTLEVAPSLLTTTPHQWDDVSALDTFNVHRCPTLSGTGLELVTKQATIRYLYHSATAESYRSGIGVPSCIKCYTSLTSDRNCLETRLCDFLGKNGLIMKLAVKLHQTVFLGCCKGTSTNACGFSVVPFRQLWVLTAPESVKCASSVESTMGSQSHAALPSY